MYELEHAEGVDVHPMRPEHFREWRADLGYTQEQAAAVLGLSLRMISYYEAGVRDGREVEIPRAIALACESLRRAHEEPSLSEMRVVTAGLGCVVVSSSEWRQIVGMLDIQARCIEILLKQRDSATAAVGGYSPTGFSPSTTTAEVES